MAAVALASRMVMPMPDNQHSVPPRDTGFTQDDRLSLNKVAWQLEIIAKQMLEFDRRVAKLEDGRAHQKELDEFRQQSEEDRDELHKQIMALQLKMATVGGVLLTLSFLEPILIKLFWH